MLGISQGRNQNDLALHALIPYPPVKFMNHVEVSAIIKALAPSTYDRANSTSCQACPRSTVEHAGVHGASSPAAMKYEVPTLHVEVGKC